MSQNPDLQSFTWAIIWLTYAIVALVGALIYFADKKSLWKKKH